VLDAIDADTDTSSRTRFSDYPLSRRTLSGLDAAGFVEPTAIQHRSLLRALKGQDVLGAAKTGSGKTLAFLIPVIERLWRLKWSKLDGVGAVVISPTRELALQTFQCLASAGAKHDMSAGLIIGGVLHCLSRVSDPHCGARSVSPPVTCERLMHCDCRPPLSISRTHAHGTHTHTRHTHTHAHARTHTHIHTHIYTHTHTHTHTHMADISFRLSIKPPTKPKPGTTFEREQANIPFTNILICTPGRLLQHLDETPNFDCMRVQVLVLDEVSAGFTRCIIVHLHARLCVPCCCTRHRAPARYGITKLSMHGTYKFVSDVACMPKLHNVTPQAMRPPRWCNPTLSSLHITHAPCP
jgi:hypothetical protein